MLVLSKLASCCPTFSFIGRRKSSLASEDDFVPLRSANCTPVSSRKQDAVTINEEGTKTYGTTTETKESKRPMDTKRTSNYMASANTGNSHRISASTVNASPSLSRKTLDEQQNELGAASQSQTSLTSDIVFEDSELGQLHFVLQYIIQKSTLYIRIIKGVNLIAQDANGLSDPYVKIHMLPDTGKKTKLRTKTCKSTLNPIWDEEFTYAGITTAELENKILRLSVLDEDPIGFDWLGEILFPIKLLANGKKEYLELFLQKKSEDIDPALLGTDDNCGKILIGLYYSPAKSELTVTIFQCVNLIAMDANGYSDPFVKLYLKPDKEKSSKYKTETKKKTLNPVYNEDFIYHVSPQDLTNKTLEVTVWDKDFGTQNDFIGALMLGNTCKLERWNHWDILLKQPYQRHDRWHSLNSELLPSSPT